MLIKDSFSLTHFFFMPPNIEKYEKLSLHNISIETNRALMKRYRIKPFCSNQNHACSKVKCM